MVSLAIQALLALVGLVVTQVLALELLGTVAFLAILESQDFPA